MKNKCCGTPFKDLPVIRLPLSHKPRLRRLLFILGRDVMQLASEVFPAPQISQNSLKYYSLHVHVM